MNYTTRPNGLPGTRVFVVLEYSTLTVKQVGFNVTGRIQRIAPRAASLQQLLLSRNLALCAVLLNAAADHIEKQKRQRRSTTPALTRILNLCCSAFRAWPEDTMRRSTLLPSTDLPNLGCNAVPAPSTLGSVPRTHKARVQDQHPQRS